MAIIIRTLLILLALTGAVLTGCTPASTREALARADSIMVAAPDSALAILDALDPATLNSDGKRARYALLRSQALDKNYIDATDDSLISIASDYYATSSDARSRMLSLYYHGRVHYNAADYPHALVMFTRSLDEARALDDSFWCGRNWQKQRRIIRRRQTHARIFCILATVFSDRLLQRILTEHLRTGKSMMMT